MSSLKLLGLKANNIGDTGLAAFADAIAVGTPLPRCERIYLGANAFGDAGFATLAPALAKGGLGATSHLYLAPNDASDGAKAAVHDSFGGSRIEL